nr:MAG TPA: CASP-domain protein [Caudoviricetes sp.]
MSVLLTATIVAALIALGAYVNVAAQRDHLERRAAELEYQLRLALERHCD